jgi:hypothetical protein
MANPQSRGGLQSSHDVRHLLTNSIHLLPLSNTRTHSSTLPLNTQTIPQAALPHLPSIDSDRECTLRVTFSGCKKNASTVQPHHNPTTTTLEQIELSARAHPLHVVPSEVPSPIHSPLGKCLLHRRCTPACLPLLYQTQTQGVHTKTQAIPIAPQYTERNSTHLRGATTMLLPLPQGVPQLAWEPEQQPWV